MTSWTKLEITSHDPCRTTLVDEHGKDAYTVTTDESGSNLVTTYKSNSGNTIATLEWHSMVGDKLALNEGEKIQKIPSRKWLKSSKIKIERTLSFEDSFSRKYTWKGFGDNNAYVSLSLYSDERPDEPIAIFNPFVPGESHKEPDKVLANLMLTPRARDIQDQVVLSYLLIEKDRRFSGGTMSMSDSLSLGFSRFVAGIVGTPMGPSI